MAFTLYQSNRQEDLFTLFAAVLQKPHGASVLTPEKVIIPSRGMAKWLNMSLAERHGIAANLSFELPAAFVWSLARALMPDVPLYSPYRPEVLTWRIYALLNEKAVLAPAVQQYLTQADNLQVYQLAHALARLFDQYLVYRPDWLMRWEQEQLVGLGEDEAWQANLWRMLVRSGGPHRAVLLQRLLQQMALSPAGLPARVLCFGVSNLPPTYLALLQRLGEYRDVHFFVLNPCKENWIDDRDYLEQLRLAGREDPQQLYLELGHPLLSSLARQGRDFFASLAQANSIDVFADDDEVERDTLLHRLQADILCRAVAGDVRPRVPVDTSLTIQSCHSPMREIEVLQDTLLHWLQADPSLKPADILVLAPDIGVYAPYIDAVFAAPDVARLPFSVADKNLLQYTPVCSTFLLLLSLPSQRLDAAWVMDVINHPALLRRFGLQLVHMPLLREWVRAVGIQWGRDAAHKTQYGLPPDDAHTWRQGLERLLLACALPQEMATTGLPVFAGRFPAPTIAVAQRDILSGFVTLMNTLLHYAQQWCTPRPVSSWVTELAGFVQACFAPDDGEEKDLLTIQTQLAELLEEVEEAQVQAAVSFDIPANALEARLAERETSQGFLGRGITFCNMVPLRALPARVICVLGLNHDAFPRQTPMLDMDLMQLHRRAGDRSRRQDDRYLFLETLISARDYLYCSYIGQDIRTNQSLPPSVLLDELLDVIDSQYDLGCSARQALVTMHYLQPFNPDYFTPQARLHSFQPAWLQVAKAQQEGVATPFALFSASLPTVKIEQPVNLDTILRFYRHPARYLLQSCLGMVLPWQEESVDTADTEILLGKRARLHVRERIAQYSDAAQQILRLEGRLPEGSFADYPYREEAEEMTAWQQNPLMHCATAPFTLAPVVVGSWQVVATLPHVNRQHGIVLRTLHDEPSDYERVTLWLQHLLLCIARPQGIPLQSTVCGLKQQYTYTTLCAEAAAALFLPWLEHFQAGLCAPLSFFVRTSFAYAGERYRGKSEEEALKAAQKKFLSGFTDWAEGVDRYVVAAYQGTPCLDAAFIMLAETLVLPLLANQHGEADVHA